MRPLTIEDLDLETKILPWLRSLDPETVVYGDDPFSACVVANYLKSLGYDDVHVGAWYAIVYGAGSVNFYSTPTHLAIMEWQRDMTAARAIEIAESILAGQEV